MSNEWAIDIIKKEFKGFDNEEFYRTEVLDTGNYIYIVSHVKPKGYTEYFHRYFVISIYKHLFNKVVYSDSNVIGNDKFMFISDVKGRTKNYLNHLLTKIG